MRISIDITERPGRFSIRYETATCVTEDTPRVLKAGELLLAQIVKAAESVLKATKPRRARLPPMVREREITKENKGGSEP